MATNERSENSNRLKLDIAFWVAFCVLFILVMKPYLLNGYYGDDAQNATIGASYALRGIGPWEAYWQIVVESFHMGRLFPIAALQTLVANTIFANHTAYRILQVGMVFSNLILFNSLILRIGGSEARAVGRYGLLVILGLFQMRFFADPIASYGVLLQVAVFFELASLYFLDFYLSGGRARSLLLFAATLTCALLTYEVSLAFVPMFFVYALVFSRGIPRAGKIAAITVSCLSATYLGLALFIRSVPATVYDGVRLNFDWQAGLTCLYQMSGALPLSYLAFNTENFTTGAMRDFLIESLNPYLSVGIFALCILVVWLIRAHWPVQKLRSQSVWKLVFLGVSLLVFPSLILSLSEKYQAQLKWGTSYLPVYVSYFGIAIFGALLFNLIRPKALIWILAVIVGAEIVLTSHMNSGVQHFTDLSYYIPRLLAEEAIAKGAFDGVPEGATLVDATYNHWFIDSFFFAKVGKRFSIMNLSELPKVSKPLTNAFLVQVALKTPTSGVVMVARLLDAEKMLVSEYKNIEISLPAGL